MAAKVQNPNKIRTVSFFESQTNNLRKKGKSEGNNSTEIQAYLEFSLWMFRIVFSDLFRNILDNINEEDMEFREKVDLIWIKDVNGFEFDNLILNRIFCFFISPSPTLSPSLSRRR